MNNLVVTLSDVSSRDKFLSVLRMVNVDIIDVDGVNVTIPGDAENKLMAILSYPQAIQKGGYNYGRHHDNV